MLVFVGNNLLLGNNNNIKCTYGILGQFYIPLSLVYYVVYRLFSKNSVEQHTLLVM